MLLLLRLVASGVERVKVLLEQFAACLPWIAVLHKAEKPVEFDSAGYCQH